MYHCVQRPRQVWYLNFRCLRCYMYRLWTRLGGMKRRRCRQVELNACAVTSCTRGQIGAHGNFCRSRKIWKTAKKKHQFLVISIQLDILLVMMTYWIDDCSFTWEFNRLNSKSSIQMLFCSFVTLQNKRTTARCLIDVSNTYPVIMTGQAIRCRLFCLRQSRWLIRGQLWLGRDLKMW